jgi:hypothetical protein
MRRHRAPPFILLTSICLGLVVTDTEGRAAIVGFFRPNTITPAAIAADPVLANMQSWSVMVTTDGNWASAGMEMTLPAGSTYYNPVLGGNTKPSPAIIIVFPQLEFDTYVTGPTDSGSAGAPAVLGFFPEQPGPGDFGGTTGRFSVSWGDLVTDPPGTYEIARITFPNGVIPTVNPLSQTSQVNPDSTFFFIPEPAGAAVILCAAVSLARRRRRLR